jgi:hypothetical protein
MRIARSVGEASLFGAFVSALCTMPAPAAFAHGAGQETGGWSVAGLTAVPLGVVLLLYSGGIARLWLRAGAGRGLCLLLGGRIDPGGFLDRKRIVRHEEGGWHCKLHAKLTVIQKR